MNAINNDTVTCAYCTRLHLCYAKNPESTTGVLYLNALCAFRTLTIKLTILHYAQHQGTYARWRALL